LTAVTAPFCRQSTCFGRATLAGATKVDADSEELDDRFDDE
jgi:hypothetical protein